MSWLSLCFADVGPVTAFNFAVVVPPHFPIFQFRIFEFPRSHSLFPTFYPLSHYFCAKKTSLKPEWNLEFQTQVEIPLPRSLRVQTCCITKPNLEPFSMYFPQISPSLTSPTN
jgi:hypothetical protein